MLRWLLTRIVLIIPTLLLSTILAFALIHLAPGDPVMILLGSMPATPQQYASMYHLLGLDQPLYVQYFIYLQRLLRMDWGYSVMAGYGVTEAVLPLVLQRAEATFELIIIGLVIGSLAGIGVGVLSAMNKGSWLDKVSILISTLAFSIPVMVSGIVLMLIFSLYLRWLPLMGRGGIQNLIMPSLVLGGWSFAMVSRVTRISMMDVLSEDFVITAKAKGLSRRKVFIKHVLRNALIPIVTVISLNFGSMIGGAVVTETLFNYPGLGSLIVERLLMRDYPVVQGSVLFIAGVFVLINLFMDVLYGRLDPRVSRAFGGGPR